MRENKIDYKKQHFCPKCLNELTELNRIYQCRAPECLSEYPIVDNIPILIDEKRSIFKINDFINMLDTTFKTEANKPSLARKFIRRVTPSLNSNYYSEKLLSNFSARINGLNKQARILIIGGSISGYGIKTFKEKSKNSFILETDVSFGPNTNIICDCHCLPFLDNSFDAVIIQAVLEHVLDPYKCVKEISRVLKAGGLVFSEVPFMQQLHQAPYDFTRFSHIGHRWLFNNYEHIDSGVVCGTGMALAWSIRGFVESLFKNKLITKTLVKIVHLLFFWLKYFDKRKVLNERALFANASSIYFIGRLTDRKITFSDLEEYYSKR